MCLIDDADGSTVSRSSWHTATKKQHRCCECRRDIAIGERYRYCFVLYEGSPGSYRTCVHCATAEDWLGVHCHGWLFEAVDEDLAGHLQHGPWSADEDRQCIKADAPARLLVGMRRKWQRFGGAGLMRVPQIFEVSHDRR